MKTYADLKRDLQTGINIELTESYQKDKEGKLYPNFHKYKNVVRQIIKKQTNGVQLEGGSWLGLGMYGEKAQDFQYIDNYSFIFENEDMKNVYKFRV